MPTHREYKAILLLAAELGVPMENPEGNLWTLGELQEMSRIKNTDLSEPIPEEEPLPEVMLLPDLPEAFPEEPYEREGDDEEEDDEDGAESSD
jgi:hypothetical protein